MSDRLNEDWAPTSALLVSDSEIRREDRPIPQLGRSMTAAVAWHAFCYDANLSLCDPLSGLHRYFREAGYGLI